MRAKILHIVFVSWALIAGCTTVTAQEDEISALYGKWRAAVESSNIDGYLAVLHEDISLRPPGVLGLDGKAAYGRFLVPVFSSANYAIQIDTPPKITLLGTSAIVEYDYTISRHVVAEATVELQPGALQAATTSAHYIDIVTQDDDGAWRVRLHSWSDSPSPTQ